ncbi:hypothetical protein SUGI_1150150 [Cryptomeria japonica]|uniref:uncharacterized protein LOC131072192 n=1 Tax=Cryptomeria japonica TaxID=3369 RepID=UPI002414BA5C|nr:uncharacterized protein LOC131072192 [Cryptomeria japonica]GLJ53861.1 hypothetical protein SUGI_1150150 [Cryptomeria japonica]
MNSVVARFGRKRAWSSLSNGWGYANILRDEADWIYSGEWWGSQDGGFGNDEGQTVFRKHSLKGNGLVSVTAHPASFPTTEQWPVLEAKLQKKYERLPGVRETNDRVRILDYQWRVLRFNNKTRESVAKVVFIHTDSQPNRVFLMQQPHCLAFPYVKSMISTGLTTLASTSFDLRHAISGSQKMRILCIGSGGGTIPLFLASKIKGAFIDVIEIDEAVISASIDSMGFPAVLKTDAKYQRVYSEHNSCGFHVKESPHNVDEVLWDNIQERLFLYEADGQEFLCNSINNSPDKEGSDLYDMVFIDAYDGDDIFPYKFRDRNGPFLTALQSKLHPRHGTVIVNLHMDSSHASDSLLQESSTGICDPVSSHCMPLGRQNIEVCRCYRDALRGIRSLEVEQAEFTLAFTVTVPFLQNLTFVVTRGFPPLGSKGSKREVLEKFESSDWLDKKLVLEKLISESQTVEELFSLPFNCFQFVRRGLFIVR